MKGLALALAVLGLVACGCGSNRSSDTERADLKAAIERMHALHSFRMETTTTGSDDHERITADFQAPDLTHSIAENPEGPSETFRAGQTVYDEDPARPGFFLSTQLKSVPQGDSPLSLLDAMLRLPVTRHGSVFSAQLPSRGASPIARARYEVTIERGFVIRTVFSYRAEGKTISATTTYSLFDKARPVVLPPPDRVAPAPVTPSCDSATTLPAGSGVFACLGHGSSDLGGAMSVPRPRTSVHSTLQLRPVLETLNSCDAPSQNPSPTDPATLPDKDGGRCLRLGPAGVTITKAKVEAVHGLNGMVDVNLELSATDARRFDELAAANYQHQVAVVMFGHVLSAPMINAMQFNGRAQISGVTAAEAGRIIAALSG